MFGTMKKAMVIAAVAGLGAVAPSVASADQWKVGGATYAGAATASGSLTLTLHANGATTSCPVSAGLSLTNPSSNAAGSVNSFLLGVPANGNPCVTSLPNCSVTASATSTSLPWTIGTAGTSVTIAGVSFTNVYSGLGCALDGQSVTATGSVTGTASGDTITFVNAGPLSTPFGPATVNGSVTVNSAGGPVSLG